MLIYMVNIKHCDCGYKTKIVGGKKTTIMEYPFIVNIALSYRENRFSDCLCGGTVITQTFILTAAHCIFDDIDKLIPFRKYDLSIIAGSTLCYNVEQEAQIVKVLRLIGHPKFQMYEDSMGQIHFYNDIAIMELDAPLKFGERVKPVNLATSTVLKSKNLFASPCEAIGWGMQREEAKGGPPELYKVQLPLIKNDKCITLLKNQNVHVLEDRVVCTYDPETKRDVCRGDSGGPLLCGNYQVGLVSGGLGCAKKNTPNIWTRVDVYYRWIQSTVQTKTTKNLPMLRSLANSLTYIKNLILVLFIYYLQIFDVNII